MGSTVFPSLPVLEELRERVSKLTLGKLDDVTFVCVQHLLESTGSLFECLISLGARPENIFVLGKCYSTNSDVLRRLRLLGLRAEGGTKPKRLGGFTRALEGDVVELWGKAMKRASRRGMRSIIVLDDGGHCLAGMPREIRTEFAISGVEQTTRGYRIGPNIPTGFPIIQVARSAAKQFVEPPMVSEAVIRRVTSALSGGPKGLRCGVIGLGKLGQAVAAHLITLGHNVNVTDLSEALSDSVQGALWCESAQKVVAGSDFVFGCAGRDVFGRPRYGAHGEKRSRKRRSSKGLSGTKTLASCSTGDIEFLALLKEAANNAGERVSDPFANATLTGANATLTILRGGFPINFDGTPESVPSADIQMTRGLLLAGLVQAVLARGQRRSGPDRWEKLDPGMQCFVVRTWLGARNPRPAWCAEGLVTYFSQRSWVQSNSHGYDAEYQALFKAFG